MPNTRTEDNPPSQPPDRIRLGISACLLGRPVRYDGGHKLDPFLAETLGAYVEWIPVCPEVECGLPVPREAMHLVGDPAAPRLLTIRSQIDHTERMLAWARRRVAELQREDLCGFVFKSRSPSSGLQRVKVYDASGNFRTTGVGLFARAFLDRFPLLPAEDEGRLHDPALRENFIERIFCLKRYRDLRAGGATRGRLVRFQADHKILFMSHSPELLRQAGRLVAQAKTLPPGELFRRYEELMLKTLAATATPRKHANALQHMMGYLRSNLSPDEKQELLEVIDQHRRELVPLVVPMTLMRHYARKYREPYLGRQVYLNPAPLELKLRNHA